MSDTRDVGTIKRAALAALLPETLTLRRDGRGRLYVVSPWSAWHMAGEQGQSALRAAGTFPEKTPENRESAPAAPPAAPQETPGAAPEPPRSRGILNFFGDLD